MDVLTHKYTQKVRRTCKPRQTKRELFYTEGSKLPLHYCPFVVFCENHKCTQFQVRAASTKKPAYILRSIIQ